MKLALASLVALNMAGVYDGFPLSFFRTGFEEKRLATPFKYPIEIRCDTLQFMADHYRVLHNVMRLDPEDKIFLAQYFKEERNYDITKKLALEVLETPNLKVIQYLSMLDLLINIGEKSDETPMFLGVLSNYPGVSIMERAYIAEKFSQIGRLDKQREILEDILTYPYNEAELPMWKRIELLERLSLNAENNFFIEETVDKIMLMPKFQKGYKIKIGKLLLDINRKKSIEIFRDIAADPQIKGQTNFLVKILLAIYDSKNGTAIIPGFAN